MMLWAVTDKERGHLAKTIRAPTKTTPRIVSQGWTLRFRRQQKTLSPVIEERAVSAAGTWF